MKHHLSKLLSALLIAALLLSPVALMEEEIEITEPVDEIVEEQSVDIVEEDTLGEEDEVATYAGESYAAGPSDVLYAAAGEIAIDAAHFPDAVFRDIISNSYDTDHSGGLSASEIAKITELFHGYGDSSGVRYVTDFTGIRYLTSLETLRLSENITTLDVSGQTSLKTITYSALTSMNVSGCTSLTEISGNAIASLNVSGCTGLINLKGYFGSLNASGCTNLEELWCEPCGMTSLNVSGCTSLKFLNCSNNNLTSLDVTGLTNLTTLWCNYNQLTSLDVSSCTNLTTLWCDVNQLTSLDVSNCTYMTELICYLNQLTSLNVRGLTELEYLNCNSNNLASVDITGCTKLLQCYTAANKQKTQEGFDWYPYKQDGTQGTGLCVSKGQKIIPELPSDSSSKKNTKIANKKLKVTAYVGTPVQMDTNGETGKSFKSSDKKVATVNSAGWVTPKKAGKCKITYKTSSANYTVTLTVKDLTVPKWVALDLKGTIAAKVGVPQTLTATMNDGAVSKLKWTTSDKKIATVKNGVVTFKKKGKVTITVTTVKGNKKAKVKFKVSK